MENGVIVIGSWDDLESDSIRIQDFVADGGSFIPIFSDEATFKQQARGSGFEDNGILIDLNLLASMLQGDEILILNPGGADPVRLKKADLISSRLNIG